MDYIELKHEYTFFIPSEDKNGVLRTDKHKVLTGIVTEYLVRHYGGYTLEVVYGGYKDNNGCVVKEKLHAVTVNTPRPFWDSELTAFVRLVNALLPQESVAIKVDGKLRLYS